MVTEGTGDGLPAERVGVAGKDQLVGIAHVVDAADPITLDLDGEHGIQLAVQEEPTRRAGR